MLFSMVLKGIANPKKILLTLYNEAQSIIKLKKKAKSKYKFPIKYNHSDLMRVGNLKRILKPLKQVAANLKHPKIQDLPINYTSCISKNNILNILTYNFK